MPTQHGVRFAAGTVVSPGEYRSTSTGAVRWFDGSTPIPGGVNSPSWEQVSDHYHMHDMPHTAHPGDPAGHGAQVRFASGTMVSAGEYRNTRSGEVRWFDGNTPLPGTANSASWQQVSDHYHVQPAGPAATRRPDSDS